ncbi:MAG: SUMF1/EgtB/PvdO family nonheme iron enzyme [Treponema sp.]|jgi:formylglycine-generating enzyme required for sulfatase activity|nr:SUMF1/EgtB/PvdO family nonheme iron enzyme [Treponema sp.]
MRKRRFALCVAALACICLAACENSIMKKWWEETGNGNGSIDYSLPVIISHPQSAVYLLGTPADAMTVTASGGNGSPLAYQWYANDVDENENGRLIPGATGTSYIPPTDDESIIYYYVVVTSTIEDNGGGRIAANVVSHTAEIEVYDGDGSGIVVTISGGLAAQDKVYDGTTAATVTGTAALNGVLAGDDVAIIKGAAAFKDANAGNNKPVIFQGWTLGGADASKYRLRMPSLTANITKATPLVTWPTGLNTAVRQTLSGIQLPGNGTSAPDGKFTWTKPGDSVGGTGSRTHNMTFTPNDTLNYKVLTQDVAVTVNGSIPTSISMNMVYIPAGTFMMGLAEDHPYYHHPNYTAYWGNKEHQVTLTKGFYMSEYVVTQDMYKSVMGHNPSYQPKPVAGESGTPGMLPVNHMNWYNALAFCNKLSVLEGLSPAYRIKNSTDPADWEPIPYDANTIVIGAEWLNIEIVPGSNGYRLPTEAQWEYACRAGTTTTFYTGDTSTSDTGWFSTSYFVNLHKVGLKPPNPWGLYDMHGNAWEWCFDSYVAYTTDAQTDPVVNTDSINRVIRGGAYHNAPHEVYSAFRSYSYLNGYGPDTSFRLVLPE